MEVERVEDGPLKNSEIIRFLEASKTSYRAVDSILTDKKEPRFQQRTLIDIASEAELRDKDSKQDSKAEKPQEAPEPESINEEDENQKAAAQKIKEEESLRLLEEKKIQDDLIALEEKEKEIYEKGFAEGKAASELETNDKIENGLIALENARKSMLDLNATHFINLRDQISSQILILSGERAGIEIKNLPEKFFKKIESLLETIGQTTKEPVIFLNAKDLDAIQDIISAQEGSTGFSFKSRDNLMHGDIIIEIGSISVKDTSMERSDIFKDGKTKRKEP